MARYHFWQYIVDEEGTPLDNVEIYFYLTGTSTPANIFLNPTTGAVTQTGVGSVTVYTDENGFFQFWVGDKWELEGGYEFSQKFRLEWVKAGIINGFIDPVDIFPPLDEVDETVSGQTAGEKEKKNKLISNALAYKWNNHVDLPVPSASPHDIQPVNLCDLNNQYNRVVSNKLMSLIYEASVGANTVNVDVSGATAIVIPTSAGEWTYDAVEKVYSRTFNHGLGNKYPIVQIADRKALKNIEIIPNEISMVDNNNTLVEVISAGNYVVTVIG
jgi:hypothetical protein